MNKILHLISSISSNMMWDHPSAIFFFVAPKHSMGPSRPTGNPAATARTNAAAPRLKGFFSARVWISWKNILKNISLKIGREFLVIFFEHLQNISKCSIVSWLTCAENIHRNVVLAHGTPGQFFASFASGCQTKPSFNFLTKDQIPFQKGCFGAYMIGVFMSLLSFAKQIYLGTFFVQSWFMHVV